MRSTAQIYQNNLLATSFSPQILAISPLIILSSSAPSLAPTSGPDVFKLTKNKIIIAIAVTFGVIVLGLFCFAFIRHFRHKMNKENANRKWEMAQAHGGFIRDSDIVSRSNPLSNRQQQQQSSNLKSNQNDLDSFFTINAAFSQINPSKPKVENSNLNLNSIFASKEGERVKPSKRASALATTLAKMTSDDRYSLDSTTRDSSSRQSGLSSRAISAGLKKLDNTQHRSNPLFNNRVANSKEDRNDLVLDTLARRLAQRRSTPDLESTLTRAAQRRSTPNLDQSTLPRNSRVQRRSTLTPGERPRESHPNFTIDLNQYDEDEEDDNEDNNNP